MKVQGRSIVDDGGPRGCVSRGRFVWRRDTNTGGLYARDVALGIFVPSTVDALVAPSGHEDAPGIPVPSTVDALVGSSGHEDATGISVQWTVDALRAYSGGHVVLGTCVPWTVDPVVGSSDRA